ncbi:MAG TPA: hypothetical protein GXZ82_15020 [Firmicutes bacterium]|jgi:hypothetical protein|nr:hypothetical protein [Bacillota bacterium]
MSPLGKRIFQFELRAQLRSPGLWAALLVVAALLLFNSVDSWESAPAQLLIKLVGGVTSFVFLLSAFVTLNGLSREEREGFSDVFYALPPTNAAIYGGKLAAAAVSLSGFLLLVLSAALLVGPSQGEFGLQYWTVSGLLLLETALAVAAGMAVAALLTALVTQHRSRYVLALLWLVGVTLLVGLGFASGRYEWLSFSPLNMGEDPYFFSLIFGFFPGSAGIARHMLVQVFLVVLLFLVGRHRFLCRRENVDQRLRRLIASALVLLVASFAWQYAAWGQYRATVAAQVNYHADARFSKADSNARADWQSLSGEGDLRYGVGVAQNFHVARYHINLRLAHPQNGLQAEVIMLIEEPTQSSLFFTLHRTLAIDGVAWQPTLGESLNAAAQSANPSWQPIAWQRAGDYLRVDLPPNAVVSPEESLLLRITYAGPTNDAWLGWWGNNPVQFVTKQGAYLQAQLGWYPLPGGWRLGAAAGVMVNGVYKAGMPPPQPLRLTSPETGYRQSEFHLQVRTRPEWQVIANLPATGTIVWDTCPSVPSFTSS